MSNIKNTSNNMGWIPSDKIRKNFAGEGFRAKKALAVPGKAVRTRLAGDPY